MCICISIQIISVFKTYTPWVDISPDFSNVVVEFGNGDMKAKASPELAKKIWEHLSENFTTRGMTIAGVEFTKAKSLVVTITPPGLSNRFMEADTQKKLCDYLIRAFEGPREALIWIYLGNPWPRIIVHEVPIDPTFPSEVESLSNIRRELLTYNPAVQENPGYITAKARLQPFSNGVIANGYTSLCLPVQNLEIAQRLVSQGVFMYGQRFKVSLGNKFNRR